VVVALTVLLATLPGRGSGPRPGGSARAATAAATAAPLLPAFGDWRAAYLAADGTLHVASLDGRRNVAVPAPTGLDERVNAAVVAPDGRTLAYIMSPKFGPIALVDLRAATPARAAVKTVAIRASDFSWAPDGGLLVADGTLDGACGLFRIGRAGDVAQVPRISCNQATILGWLDATHALADVPSALLASVRPRVGSAAGPGCGTPPHARVPQSSCPGPAAPPSSSPFGLAALDVTTGALRPIAEPDGWAALALAPDGRTLLLTSLGCGQDRPEPPTHYALVDLATGQLRPLPALDQLAPQGLAAAAWAPDSGSLLVVAIDPTDDNAPLVRVDAAGGATATIATGYLPAAWTPDGRTLLLVTQASLRSMSPTHTHYALAPAVAGAKLVPVAADVDRFLGLARTA
jgi:hypothetical protein